MSASEEPLVVWHPFSGELLAVFTRLRLELAS
jgi:hypothetical protein